MAFLGTLVLYVRLRLRWVETGTFDVDRDARTIAGMFGAMLCCFLTKENAAVIPAENDAMVIRCDLQA